MERVTRFRAGKGRRRSNGLISGRSASNSTALKRRALSTLGPKSGGNLIEHVAGHPINRIDNLLTWNAVKDDIDP
jgi:hypothetical protein